MEIREVPIWAMLGLIVGVVSLFFFAVVNDIDERHKAKLAVSVEGECIAWCTALDQEGAISRDGSCICGSVIDGALPSARGGDDG